MDSTSLSKDKAINLLIQYVENAQKQGAFLLSESKILKQAKDYFDPSVKEKIPFTKNDDQNQEHMALDLLAQAASVGNRKGAFSLDDAAIVHDIIASLQQMIKKEQEASTSAASSSSSSSSSQPRKRGSTKREPPLRAIEEIAEEDESEDEEEQEAQMFRSVKGKGLAR